MASSLWLTCPLNCCQSMMEQLHIISRTLYYVISIYWGLGVLLQIGHRYFIIASIYISLTFWYLFKFPTENIFHSRKGCDNLRAARRRLRFSYLGFINGAFQILCRRSMILWNIDTQSLILYIRTELYKDFQNQTVLELGAGTGLVGITCNLLGARVTLTDQKAVLSLLQENVQKNCIDNCTVQELNWYNHFRLRHPISLHIFFLLQGEQTIKWRHHSITSWLLMLYIKR